MAEAPRRGAVCAECVHDVLAVCPCLHEACAEERLRPHRRSIPGDPGIVGKGRRCRTEQASPLSPPLQDHGRLHGAAVLQRHVVECLRAVT